MTAKICLERFGDQPTRSNGIISGDEFCDKTLLKVIRKRAQQLLKWGELTGIKSA